MILPLYVLRKYDELFEERGFKCIRTPRSWYVLDYLDFEEPDYSNRRIQLLADYLPYRLYPINVVLYTLEEAISYKKSKIFYTDSGKILKWKKEKFYRLEDHFVRSSWVTDLGETVLDIKDYGIAKIRYYDGEPYAKIATIGKQKVLYCLAKEKGKPPLRIKV